ncbi:hypothetical protein JQN72_04290 [Phycicoccus sp. CSK15P-2]|uniref:hypothetical protein n=1 Tax=Phycicoccus sp. CSK15P-2 TaxID=2807627 RepID=UPI001951C2AB|nr:hypothetical protein [Phycicoccus sp. CSK15P-2]MBM6403461.1 hypothetical protein [Phycicoccus sp. CSK15P-2]
MGYWRTTGLTAGTGTDEPTEVSSAPVSGARGTSLEGREGHGAPNGHEAAVARSASGTTDPGVGSSGDAIGPNGGWASGTPTDGYAASLDQVLAVRGALGAAVVDSSTGRALATAGDPADVNLHAAAAGTSNVVLAQQLTLDDLGSEEKVTDIVVTLRTRYHLARMVEAFPGVFVYAVLDRDRADLATARAALAEVERGLVA